MNPTMPHRPALQSQISAGLAEVWLRVLNMSRYPGEVFMDIVIPIVLAAIPLLLGRSTSPQAGSNFAANVGTANYVAYLLIGSNAFTLVSSALWHVAYWLRFEQETGTLEAIYLTPTSSLSLASGVAVFSAMRSLTANTLAYVIGCLIFGVNPLQGDLLLAFVFVLVGLIPMFGVTFLFGALVLRVKESNALVGLMQWVVSLLMGIWFPVLVLPPLVRALAFLFPPTWMVNGVRSSLLGVGYFFGTWYADLAVLWVFMLFVPLFSVWVFRRVERGVRLNEGVGEF
jgi:ABC-2 type transport system permease protein